MKDTGSIFKQNAALKGGVIYAENTPVTLIGATITESYAYKGGVFYFYDKSPLTVESSTFNKSIATGNGGIGYFESKPLATGTYAINFTSPTSLKTTFTNQSAISKGGAFYVDSKQITSILFSSVIGTQSSSLTDSGGFMYVNTIGGKLTIEKSEFDTFSSPKAASFLYSEDIDFSMTSTNSNYQCSKTPPVLKQVSNVLGTTVATIGGAFYVANSVLGVTTTLNTFTNCYTCHSGGAFTLVSTSIVDTTSSFFNNAAVNGGVFKCENCKITLTDSKLYNNDALNGAILESQSSVTMTATNTPVYINKATGNGGVLSVTNPEGAIQTAGVITFTKCKNIYQNRANYGGFAYYDN